MTPSNTAVAPMSCGFVQRLCCPQCGGKLRVQSPGNPEGVLQGRLECVKGGHLYNVEEGIPNLFVRWTEDSSAGHPFPQFLVSPEHLGRLAHRIGADRVILKSELNPRNYVSVRRNKLFIGMRLALWGCLAAALAGAAHPLVWASVAAAGFLADFLWLQAMLRRQYRLELAQLLRYSKDGRLHEKDIKDPLADADQLDLHEVAENRAEDIGRALAGVDLKGKDVLHVGCGGEHDADVAQVYQDRGARLVGLDVYVPSLISFKRIFRAEGLLAEALALPFPDASFDFINATDIIEHVHDPFQFLKENWRVLKPGGQMLLITPNRARLRRTYIILNPLGLPQSALGSRFPRLMPPRDMVAIHRDYIFFHTSFTKSELDDLVRAAGFERSWSRITAYRGAMKRARRAMEKWPVLNTLNDSLFALVRKPIC